MTYGHRLRALQVRITGHRPAGVGARLGREDIDRAGDLAHELARGRPAVEPQVESHLVVARATRVESRTRWCDLRQSPFDGRMYVLVRLQERKRVRIELALDAAQPSFNGGQLLCRQEARGGEPSGMRDAAGDVVRIELEVDLQR